MKDEKDLRDAIDDKLNEIKEPSKSRETKPIKTDDKPIKSTDTISKEKKSKVAYVVLVTVVVIVAIIIAGFQYGIIDLDTVQNNADEDYFEDNIWDNNGYTTDDVLEDAEPYLSEIVTSDVEIRAYANSIIKDCPDNDKECQINEIYRYIVENFNYVSDPRDIEYIQSPQDTIQIGGGDCEDLSILFNSLLENIGIKTYLVLTDTHAYSLAYDVDVDSLWVYVEQSLIEQIEEDWGDSVIQTYEKTFVLNGYNNWYYGGDGTPVEDYNTDYLNISYTIESSQPLDLYVVPSRDDFNDFVDGKSFSNYPDCKEENILSLTEMCSFLGNNGGIILSNNNWGDATVQVNLEFYFRPSFYGNFKDNVITYYNIDGKKCIVVDCTAGDYGYPGYDGDITGEKIAIDPITLEYTYLD